MAVGEALERGPQAHWRIVEVLCVGDLCSFLWQQRSIQVSVYAVRRAMRRLGRRYRRPGHLLHARHRQDQLAVACVKEVDQPSSR